MNNQVSCLLEENNLSLDYLNRNFTNSILKGTITHFQDIDALKMEDVFLFHVSEVTYQEKAPRREAVENVFGAFSGVQGINIIYMLIGSKDHVDFYFGLAKDKSFKGELKSELADIAKAILQPGLKSNFRGCVIEQISDVDQKNKILKKIEKASRYGVLEGVPCLDKQQQGAQEQLFQGVDRLIDVMNGKNFGLIVIAQPCSTEDIKGIGDNLSKSYDVLAPLAKHTLQHIHTDSTQKNKSSGFNISRQSGKNIQKGDTYTSTKSDSRSDDTRTDESSQITAAESDSENHQTSRSQSFNESHTNGSSGSSRDDHTISRVANGDDSDSHNHSENKTYSNTLASSTSDNHATNESESHSNNENRSYSDNFQRSKSTNKTTALMDNDSMDERLEVENKNSQLWLDYLDKVLFPRYDKGCGKGIFVTGIFLFADNNTSLLSLANTSQSIFSGNETNKAVLNFTQLDNNKQLSYIGKAFKALQIPIVKTNNYSPIDVVLSRVINNGFTKVGSWISSGELALVAGIPQREVAGLSLRKEVEYGLNVPRLEDNQDNIKLGFLVESGEVKENMQISLPKKNLDSHTFITGVTGSGKTVTSQKLLLESGLPFLVVEPAKTEYRVLKGLCPDLVFFTPGRQDYAPFFLNPFELFPGEAITSRADMLKATMEASFDMEAAIPQILESAIYLAYRKKGWNIRNNKWYGKNEKNVDGPFADGVYAFPTLTDFVAAVEEVTNEQGFSQRLKDDYLGSLKARLLGLTEGAKGMMLNTSRSINFKELVHQKIVIELEEIKNVAEKSLIMGFIITNLMEAVKYAHREASKKGERFQHITLIEEAHRLLSRYTPGDSVNKKQGVETFADMLAEVRKYGESLVIVDQIPEKMTPEVLKNTNTKIVHRLFAQDDKDAIGNTIVLEDNQKAFLSNLQQGRAVVFSSGWAKAVQVMIEKKVATEGYKEIDPEKLNEWAVDYYVKHYKNGVLRGLEHSTGKVGTTEVRAYLSLMLDDESLELFKILYSSKSYKYGSKDLGSDDEQFWEILSGKVKASLAVEGLTVENYKLYIYWNVFAEESKEDWQFLSSVIELLAQEKIDINKIKQQWSRRV